MGRAGISRVIALGLAAGTLFAAAPVSAAPTDDRQTCEKASGDVALAACSRAIATGRYKGSVLGKLYYSRAFEYQSKGDLDHALADFSEAIRLEPKSAFAYHNRGYAYGLKGDPDRAIADYNEAIRVDPKYAFSYNNRGAEYRRKGDLDRAIADYNEAIRLDPRFTDAYGNRSRAYFYGGSLPEALADARQASKLDPKDAYAALWLDIVGQRSGVPSHLPQAIARIDMTAWPAPVIRMFMGQLTAAAVLAVADDPDATKKKEKVCETNFYSGELALRQGAKDEAIRLFRIAVSDCPHDFGEWFSANAQLKALGAAP